MDSISQSRFSVIKTLMATWRRPLMAEDGVPEAEIRAVEEKLGFRFSEALREWYRMAGGRRGLFDDPMISVEELELRNEPGDGVLRFWDENQGVVVWGIRREDMAMGDPPVMVYLEGYVNYLKVFEKREALPSDLEGCDEQGGKWVLEASSVSSFLLWLVYNSVTIRAPFSRSGEIDDAGVRSIVGSYPLLFGEENSTQVYGNEDTLISVYHHDDSENSTIQQIEIAARNGAAMKRAVKLAGMVQDDLNDDGR